MMKSLILLVSLLTVSILSTGDTKPIPSYQADGALSFVRNINTAEMRFKHRTGKYASQAEILESAELRDIPKSTPQPPAGYEFSLLSDGTQYTLLLKKRTATDISILASDQAGFIYVGSVLK